MKIYEIKTNNGELAAFEIDHVYISKKNIVELLSSLDGVSNVSPNTSNSDVHIEFVYLGSDFIVWEPFADNSRYWIGPENDGGIPGELRVNEIASVFRSYMPTLLRRLIGNILSLKLTMKK